MLRERPMRLGRRAIDLVSSTTVAKIDPAELEEGAAGEGSAESCAERCLRHPIGGELGSRERQVRTSASVCTSFLPDTRNPLEQNVAASADSSPFHSRSPS